MIQFLEKINLIVWGVPALLLIIGVGIYLTVCTGFAQIQLFPRALKAFLNQFWKRQKTDGTSPFRALCTALAATVGTGNLAGVAGAIALGGPGTIFWMWICGLLGMVTKFAEATLSVRYRFRNKNDEYVGGPMYMIEQGMRKRWRFLAVVYAFFGVVASFGVGNATQINAVVGSMNSAFTAVGIKPSTTGNLLIGIALAVLVVTMLLGGAKRIGSVAERLVPFASIGYILLGTVVIIGRFQLLPSVFASIVQGAFSPNAVTGGMVGSAFSVLRIGASRGVFTNEAGMGTASIAHGSANAKNPVAQGLMGIMEVFLDTIVICTVTALVILCSGASIPYGTDVGIALTTEAYSNVLGDWVNIPIALALCCFAIATVLGWGLYGIRSTEYLFGANAWKWFVFFQGGMVVFGAVSGTGIVWLLSEIVNGLMAIPNLIALAALSPELVRLCKAYKKGA